MDKWLNISKIENKTLRDRQDMTLLEKTAIHMYHYENMDSFQQWLTLLDDREKRIVNNLFATNYYF